MTRKLIFDLVNVGSFALPLLVALSFAAIPYPRPALVRAGIAVAAAWGVSVVYTIYLYNPAGIAAGHELGWDSPEMRFDNNTVASHLLRGWIYPSIIVAAFFALRHVRRRGRAGMHQ